MPGQAPVSLDNGEGSRLGKRKRDSVDKPMTASQARKAKRALKTEQEQKAQIIAKAAMTAANTTFAERLASQTSSIPLEEGELQQDPLRRVHVDFKFGRALKLPQSDIRAFLSGAPKLSISRTPHTVFVRPNALSTLYQCAGDGFVEVMPAESNPSGDTRRMIAHLQPKENPAMPLFPGMSGVLLGYQQVGFPGDERRWSLFRKVGSKGSSGKDSVYLGEYEITVVGQMTKEQFCAQERTVQIYHARQFLTKARHGLLRSRIHNKMGRPATEADIVQALKNGEETFDIIRLKCVEYDHNFIEHIELALAAWKQAKRQASANDCVGATLSQTSDVDTQTESLTKPIAGEPCLNMALLP